MTNSDTTSASTVLTWRAPASDGGAPVTGYYVEQLSQFSSRWSKVNKKSISELTLTLTDLTMGEKYEVKVAAENEAGVGPFCDPISFIAKDPFGTKCLIFFFVLVQGIIVVKRQLFGLF